MSMQRNVIALILIAAASLAGCAAREACQSGECRSDSAITADVQAKLNQYPDLGPPNLINVETRNHIVYLSGSVSAGIQKETAEEVSTKSPGVERVVNTIEVTH
jgi:osmotically-inducible protein OsmY